jgi:hypothetical protein
LLLWNKYDVARQEQDVLPELTRSPGLMIEGNPSVDMPLLPYDHNLLGFRKLSEAACYRD